MTEGSPSTRMTYGGYLQLDDLLSLQDGPEGYGHHPSNDELHFIIVHQTFELWFKMILRELKESHSLLDREHVAEQDIPRIVHHLDRVSEIFRLLTQQWKVMETLTPQDFLSFRDRLGTSSGFESWQLRELELLLGLHDEQRVGGMNPIEHMRKLHQASKISDESLHSIEQTAQAPSLYQLLMNWLARTPIHGSLPSSNEDSRVLHSFIEHHLEAMRVHGEGVIQHMVAIGHGLESEIRARIEAGINSAKDFLMVEGQPIRSRIGLLFIESYRELPLLTWPRTLIDAFVELEQSMILFRSHHARMVERMIGRRMGTGGSSGVDYLDATTKYRIFVELWEVRTLLLKRELLPEVQSIDYYGFQASQDS